MSRGINRANLKCKLCICTVKEGVEVVSLPELIDRLSSLK